MMFAFAEGNTFLATAAGSLAGVVGGISLVFVPWTGIQLAYVEAAEGNILLGTLALYKVCLLLILMWATPVLILTLYNLSKNRL